MKRSFRKRKFICKNSPKIQAQKSTYSKRRKSPVQQGFFGHRRLGNSDKEGSHVVGIFSGKGESQ